MVKRRARPQGGVILIRKYVVRAVVKACEIGCSVSMMINMCWEIMVAGTYTNRDRDVLREHNPLELNDKEIAQLRQILHHALQRLPRDGIVSLRPHLRREALSKYDSASNLCRGGDTEDHVGCFQNVAYQRDIASGDDEDQDTDVADGSGTRVLPAQQIVEEGVVVGQRLPVGGLDVGRAAGGGEVGEFVLGRCGFGARFIGHWA